MWLKIVELLYRFRDVIARGVSAILPRVVKYWVVLRMVSDYTLAHPEQVADLVKAMDLLASLERKTE